ncbi:MAG: cytochrome c oxidase subunit II transmembrane domain-containing protein [Candidatus Hodgkinia cicadicola]
MLICAPKPWQVGASPSATQTMRETTQLMRLTNATLLPAAASMVCVMVSSCLRRANRLTPPLGAGALLEIIWSATPAAILAAICSTSLKVLKYQLHVPSKPFVTVKVVAHQWRWHYEYNLNGRRVTYNSNILRSDCRTSMGKTNLAQYPALLATDYELILPERKIVRFLITSADVVHSFCVPAFGVKMDAIPGKVNVAWVKALRSGLYYGQCSEYCGRNHAFMPIAVRVTSQTSFAQWGVEASRNLDNAFRSL